MEALGRSCLKISPCKHFHHHVEKEKGFGMRKQGNWFHVCNDEKRVGFGVSLSVEFQHKYYCIHSISSDTQATVETEEIQISADGDQPKTVRVRFKLQKECAFGQKFLIVGDDSMLGSWDPTEGVPLDWSDGHIWTAEIDVPSGKTIKYKVILQANAGTILWQPGPDRNLETWDTENTITVFEHWDDPQLRNIVEEEVFLVTDQDISEESLINSDLDADMRETISDDEGPDSEVPNAEGLPIVEDEPSVPMVAENMTEALEEQDSSISDHESPSGLVDVTDHKKKEVSVPVNPSYSSSPNKETLLDEGIPVLIPGLIPMPLEEEVEEPSNTPEEEIDEESTPQGEERSNAVESKSSIGSDEVEITTPELKDDEHVSASYCPTETTGEMIHKSHESLNGREQLEHSILESDVQWGLRTIQKFLATLGFQAS